MALFSLNPVESRILGCLLEKEQITPENYPLSLNSLIAACNQSTNRDPVVAYDEKTVEAGLDALREKKLATMTLGAGSRVPKYRHNFLNHFELNQREVACSVSCCCAGRRPRESFAPGLSGCNFSTVWNRWNLFSRA